MEAAYSIIHNKNEYRVLLTPVNVDFLPDNILLLYDLITIWMALAIACFTIL